MGGNIFKEYLNKSSIAKDNTRMLNGGTTFTKGNKLGWWERNLLQKDPVTDKSVRIIEQYEFRPDLVAYDFLGSTKFTWLILQYNNIVDINEEFARDKIILVPEKNRAHTLFGSKNPIRGQNE